MKIDARLDTLGRKHAELDALIAAEMKHPALDERRVHDLKRRKLAIKDEMTTLSSGRGSR